MKYSKSTGGFYDQFSNVIPNDALEVTDEKYTALFVAQSVGKVIVADDSGNPIAIDLPPPTENQLAIAARVQRDLFIFSTDWLVARHRDQTDEGTATTLAAEQFKVLLAYRHALREFPKQQGFPAVAMPIAPDFL